MNPAGQLSLETLLITAAFLALLALFVPLLQTVLSGGLWGLENARAQAFADSFRQKTALLNALGNESALELPVSTAGQWVVRLQGNELELLVSENEKEKAFSRSLSLPVFQPTELTLSGSEILFLKKSQGFLIVDRQGN